MNTSALSQFISLIGPEDNQNQGQGVVILDGGLATELEFRGHDLNNSLWSAKLLIDAPDEIKAVHRSFYEAGADCVITASYQAHFEGFAEHGVSKEKAVNLVKMSATLAHAARDEVQIDQKQEHDSRPKLVAGSIGCFGASLHDGSEYTGNYGRTKAQLKAFHRDRISALISSSVDILACETIPCIVEAEALVELIDQEFQFPFWMTFSCKDYQHICSGELFRDAVKAATQSKHIVSVGVNCTSPQYITNLLKIAARETSLPLCCYPNSGELWDGQNHRWLHPEFTQLIGDETEPAMVAKAVEWYDVGARLIGGCCRTRPSEISKLKRKLFDHVDRLRRNISNRSKI